ncbi:MAG: hypothetical protein WHX93_08330 [bacterium]
MAAERRKEQRRESDRILMKILEILRVVEKLSRGEQVDFTEAYADLVGLKDQLGRRKEDRELGEALCVTVGAIACNVAQRGSSGQQMGRRRIRLTRLGGGKGETHRIIEGWENEEPRVGKSYLIFQEGGRVLRTSPLTRISGAFVQTRNSLYQIEILDDPQAARIHISPSGEDEKKSK